MQKFLEAPDRKRSDACAKKQLLNKRKKPVLFLQVTGGLTTLNLSCCW